VRIGIAVLLACALAGTGCGGDGGSAAGDSSTPASPSGSPANQGLEGTWLATSAVFTSASNPAKRTDVVAQGTAVKLELTTTGFALSYTDTGQAPKVTNGTWSSTKDVLLLKPAGVSWSWEFDMNQSGNSLSLSGASVEFDFAANGVTEQAKLSMTLVRQ